MRVTATWSITRGCWLVCKGRKKLGTAFQLLIRDAVLGGGRVTGELEAAIWEQSTTDHYVMDWEVDPKDNNRYRRWANDHGARVNLWSLPVAPEQAGMVYLTWEHRRRSLDPKPRVMAFDPCRMTVT